jgi:hypothetical protein
MSDCPDLDAPFRRYANVGLVNARFAIDDGPAFWGYHDPAERWNGWAVPRFTREAASLIADWLNSGEAGQALWDGETLAVRGQSEDPRDVDRIEPDPLGCYRFDGWCWLETE